jgi:hypothetical protein
MKNIILFLMTFAYSIVGCTSVGVAAGFDPVSSAAVGTGLGVIYHAATSQSGVVAMAIQKEIWVDYIIGNLFKDNEFLNYCFNADMYVIDGSLVHIPQAGSASGVKRNRTNLPATITQRQDVDITYALDEFTTDPRLIVNADTHELSYDKIGSVLQEDLSALKELIAEWMLYKWAPSGTSRIVRTSGSNVAAHLPSATGNRKALLVKDLKNAQKIMNKDGVSKSDRFALLSSDMYAQLTDDTTFNTARDSVKEMNLPEGTVARLYGFTILERSTVLTYDATPAAKLPGAAGATTDNDCVLCWQKMSLEKAMGSTEAFENLNDPTFFGDVYSFLQRMGGRIRYADQKGVVAIVQTT